MHVLPGLTVNWYVEVCIFEISTGCWVWVLKIAGCKIPGIFEVLPDAKFDQITVYFTVK